MVENKKAKNGSDENELHSVKINFRIPVKMPSVYAHHLFVQEEESEVVLSFFEIISPIIPGSNEMELLEAISQAGINAECVARIRVAKHRFSAFADVIKEIAKSVKAESVEKKKNA